MKTARFKTFTTTLALITTISFSSIVWAEDVVMPVVSKPTILQEGTQRDLTPSQVAELLPWAKDSKMFLNDLLSSIQNLSSADKVERMIEGIKTVVGESAPRNTELLMRYSLNRALVVNDILKKEMDTNEVGAIDAQIRVLILSIKLAIKYYDTDMLILSKKSLTPYVVYGLDYFSFLTELNKSIFDASAQYNIQRTSLEWLQWDLYRDLNNAGFAPQIVKINNSLKIFPSKKLTDAQSISYIRQMKVVSQELRVQETLTKIENDLRLAQAASAAERARIQREQEEQEQIRKTGPIVNTVQVFKKPSINGVLFSSSSNRNGVCKMLGFQKSADQSTSQDSSARGSMIIVDGNGEVIGGEIATDKEGFSFEQITCLNKILGYKNTANVEKVSKLNISGILVSSRSNENGLCHLLGYEKGVVKSGLQDSTTRGSMVIVDDKGNPTNGEIATNTEGFSFSEVVCINKKSGPLMSLIKIHSPKIQGSIVSSTSNANGVCKLLGHRGGVTGAGELDAGVRGTMLVIDITGEIVNSEMATASSGFGLLSVICIK